MLFQVSVPLRGDLILSLYTIETIRSALKSRFRPLTGITIPKPGAYDGYIRAFCDVSVPLRGELFLNWLVLCHSERRVRVSVPLRGELFLNSKTSARAQRRIMSFRPLTGITIPKPVTIESKHHGKATFPSPYGDNYS